MRNSPTPISVTRLGMLKIPVPKAEAIMPNKAATYGVLGSVLICCAYSDVSDMRLYARLLPELMIT